MIGENVDLTIHSLFYREDDPRSMLDDQYEVYLDSIKNPTYVPDVRPINVQDIFDRIIETSDILSDENKFEYELLDTFERIFGPNSKIYKDLMLMLDPYTSMYYNDEKCECCGDIIHAINRSKYSLCLECNDFQENRHLDEQKWRD